MSSEKSMTPADIERATVERCAKVCADWFGDWPDGKDVSEEIRALPPMFGDVPAGWIPVTAWDQDAAIEALVDFAPRSSLRAEMIEQIGFDPTSGPIYGLPIQGRALLDQLTSAFFYSDPTAGQAATKTCGPVELITEREMAIRTARKLSRLMLTEEGHEVVCIDPKLWEAICSRAAAPEVK